MAAKLLDHRDRRVDRILEGLRHDLPHPHGLIARQRHGVGWGGGLDRLDARLWQEADPARVPVVHGVSPSSFTRTVRMALVEKGLAHRLEPARPHTPEQNERHPFEHAGKWVHYEPGDAESKINEMLVLRDPNQLSGKGNFGPLWPESWGSPWPRRAGAASTTVPPSPTRRAAIDSAREHVPIYARGCRRAPGIGRRVETQRTAAALAVGVREHFED